MITRRPPPITEGAFREARRSGIPPLRQRVREEVGARFEAAGGWREVREGLALQGYRLEPGGHPCGVVVTDGRRRASISRIAWDLSGPKLAERFGESVGQHREKHPLPPAIELWAAERARGSALGEKLE